MHSVAIAQISDLHVEVKRAASSRRKDRGEALVRCVDRINSMRPDVVIATGDLTHTGRDDEYVRLRAILNALRIPYFLLPGNHDSRDALRRVFSDHSYLFETSPHIAYTVNVGDVRIIALDSTEGRRIGGYLDEPRLYWLRRQLEDASARPVMLALHQPPFRTGVWPMDTFRFVNRDALAELLKQHPNVQRVLCGHVHCAQAIHWADTVACTSPTPFSQWLLRSYSRVPLHPTFERAGFLFHTLDGSAPIKTRVMRMNGSIEELIR